MTECLACHSKVVEPLYSAGPQPLMALNLPKSKEEAGNATLYPMNFYMCCFCGHVFNSDFDYAKVPYQEDSNLMYNKGLGWSTHLIRLSKLLLDSYRTLGKTIIDIGAGDGGFLDIVNRQSLDNGVITKCIAFEPGIESETCRKRGLEVYTDYFIPRRDLQRLKPDTLVCRHVLEHLQDPRSFVAEIFYYANKTGIMPTFVAEVPCITKAIKTHRITDFLYEHVSNFTQRSLRVMFESVGWTTYDEFLTYNNEVAVWIGKPKQIYLPYEDDAKSFRDRTWDSVRSVHTTLDLYFESGKTVALWGGTGKGAAFLNAYHIKNGRVVDSDKNKVGRFVPGTAQRIEHSDSLIQYPTDVIVITTRWRAADIYAEIKRKGIQYDILLVLEDSCLLAYTEAEYAQEA